MGEPGQGRENEDGLIAMERPISSDVLVRNAELYPHQEALVIGEQRLTNERLDAGAHRFGLEEKVKGV
jgi:hypothetical protein